jgi:hypothetical protein
MMEEKRRIRMQREGFRYIQFVICAFICISLVLIFACTTSQEEVVNPVPESQVAVTEVPTEEEKPIAEPGKDQSENIPSESDTNHPAQATEETAEAAKNTFTVSEELYTKTFQDVEKLIEELNAIIQAEDYEKWLSYLTEDYKNYYSDPDVLKEQSEKPLLKRYNIRLRTLKDYFLYVVVRSRQTTRLDALEFTDETHVKATMLIDGTPYILYYLEYDGKAWKIGRYQ